MYLFMFRLPCFKSRLARLVFLFPDEKLKLPVIDNDAGEDAEEKSGQASDDAGIPHLLAADRFPVRLLHATHHANRPTPVNFIFALDDN